MFLSCQATCRAHSAELVIIDTPEENEFIRLEIIKLKGKKRKEKQKYRSVGTIPKSNRKIVPRGKIDIPSIHTHGYSLSQLGTCTWILTFLAYIYMATHFPSIHIHGHSLSQHTYTWPLTFLARYMYFNEKKNIRPHI